MNSVNKTFRLTALSVLTAFAVAAAAACSGDDNNSNPAPTTDSGSTGSDVTVSGDDSSTPTGDSSTTPPGDSTTPPIDAPSLDTGSCKSSMTTCNTCYTAAQAATDPYNGCTTYTAACQGFDPGQVPSHPML
jgi:hypothetical protein